jgi:hypothetical protein
MRQGHRVHLLWLSQRARIGALAATFMGRKGSCTAAVQSMHDASAQVLAYIVPAAVQLPLRPMKVAANAPMRAR